MLMAPPPATKEEYFERFAQTWKVLRVGSSRRRSWRPRRTHLERGLNPPASAASVLASGSRKERLRAVKAPTLVIHGTVDPLVRPEGGKDTRPRSRREAADDRRHGPRAADPDVAADHRCRQARVGGEGGDGSSRAMLASGSRKARAALGEGADAGAANATAPSIPLVRPKAPKEFTRLDPGAELLRR
jgi:hypothetical protein